MKKLLLILILLVFFLIKPTFSQYLNFYDLYLIQGTEKIQISSYFLTQHKGWNYIGNLGEDEYGNTIYKFSKYDNWLEIRYQYLVDSNRVHYQVIYYVSDEQTKRKFISDIKKNTFENREGEKMGEDGNLYSIWMGIFDGSVNTIIIKEVGTIYEIYIF